MNKSISVGNTVEMLLEHYSKYNPFKYLGTLSENQKKQDHKIIQSIQKIDILLSKKIDSLNVSLLTFSSPSEIEHKCKEALDLLSTYSKYVNSLAHKDTQRAKSIYKDWSLKWMLEYIKEASMEYDEEYAKDHRLDVTQEVEHKIKDLRDYYGIEESEEDTD